MIRIIFAEDHLALVEGFESFLKSEPDIRLIGSAPNGKLLCELVRKKSPDIVIMDIRMPVMDGIEATREIHKTNPDTRVIALTMFDQDEAVSQMMEAGAKGYILKNSSLKDLLTAIREVHNGNQYLDSRLTWKGELRSRKTKTELTRRQMEILKLVAQGKTNQEIADQLFIGKTTVETHRKNMIRILDLKGPGELLRYALESKYKF